MSGLVPFQASPLIVSVNPTWKPKLKRALWRFFSLSLHCQPPNPRDWIQTKYICKARIYVYIDWGDCPSFELSLRLYFRFSQVLPLLDLCHFLLLLLHLIFAWLPFKLASLICSACLFCIFLFEWTAHEKFSVSSLTSYGLLHRASIESMVLFATLQETSWRCGWTSLSELRAAPSFYRPAYGPAKQCWRRWTRLASKWSTRSWTLLRFNTLHTSFLPSKRHFWGWLMDK